jgi:hypothetical protein
VCVHLKRTDRCAVVTRAMEGFWTTKVRCGTCRWPIVIRFDVTDPRRSILMAEHESETSAQAMGCDWRVLGADELQRLLRGVVNEVCAKTMCMEYAGQHVRMDGTLVGGGAYGEAP